MTVTNYPVGDFLIQIKNAALAGKNDVEFVNTKFTFAVANALKDAGFLSEVVKNKEGMFVKIAYKNKRPVLLDIKLISKPGLRIYKKADEIKNKKGPSTYLISTPQGVVSSRLAIKKRLGGELLAEIW